VPRQRRRRHVEQVHAPVVAHQGGDLEGRTARVERVAPGGLQRAGEGARPRARGRLARRGRGMQGGGGEGGGDGAAGAEARTHWDRHERNRAVDPGRGRPRACPKLGSSTYRTACRLGSSDAACCVTDAGSRKASAEGRRWNPATGGAYPSSGWTACARRRPIARAAPTCAAGGIARAHPRTSASLGGWAWGSEVMTAWGAYFTRYEDYEGSSTSCAAARPTQLWGASRGSSADSRSTKRTRTAHGGGRPFGWGRSTPRMPGRCPDQQGVGRVVPVAATRGAGLLTLTDHLQQWLSPCSRRATASAARATNALAQLYRQAAADMRPTGVREPAVSTAADGEPSRYLAAAAFTRSRTRSTGGPRDTSVSRGAPGTGVAHPGLDRGRGAQARYGRVAAVPVTVR
jgi:hypothetical protein